MLDNSYNNYFILKDTVLEKKHLLSSFEEKFYGDILKELEGKPYKFRRMKRNKI